MRENGFSGFGVADDIHCFGEFEMLFDGLVFEIRAFQNEQIGARGKRPENFVKARVSRVNERLVVVFDSNRKAFVRVRRL